MTRAKLKPLVLDPEQRMAVERITSEATMSALNASLMGSGKTLMATEAVLASNVKTVLIIGPLNTYWGWYDTIQRQTGYTANVKRIDSSNAGRQAMNDMIAGVEGWYFIGREFFRTKDWTKIKPDYVLVDEVHFAQNRNSRSHKALMKLKSDRKLAMSGTPFGNKFEGAWAITRWLWPNMIPASFWKWVYQWCNLGYSPFTKHEILGELNPGEFTKSLPCYIRIEPNHNIEVVEETIYVDLVPAQRKVYSKFQKDLVVWLQDNPLVAEVPIAARIRLRQMTLAVPSIDEDGGIYFAEDAVSTKWKALSDLIDDNEDEPMFILTDSQKYAKIVTDRLNKKFGKTVAFEWSGQANQKQREAAKQAFLKQELKFIVAVIPAIAEGVDGLQDVCSTIVWLSHSDNNLMNQQVVDRIRRRGQSEIVKIYDIIARDTYDEGQLDALLDKQLKMNATLRKEEE